MSLIQPPFCRLGLRMTTRSLLWRRTNSCPAPIGSITFSLNTICNILRCLQGCVILATETATQNRQRVFKREPKVSYRCHCAPLVTMPVVTVWFKRGPKASYRCGCADYTEQYPVIVLEGVYFRSPVQRLGCHTRRHHRRHVAGAGLRHATRPAAANGNVGAYICLNLNQIKIKSKFNA